MFKAVLPQNIQRLLQTLKNQTLIKNFYLVGGMALALQLSHRQSIDLDWFSFRNFSSNVLKNQIRKVGKISVISQEEGTLNLILNQVKVSFFYYPYKLLFPLIQYEKNVKLADPRDIACMKLEAIASRGGKKDFIDLYFLLKKYSLAQLLKLFDKKYQGIKYNHLHLLKSLLYFQDAEREPTPKMIKRVSWQVIKKEIIVIVKKYLREAS